MALQTSGAISLSDINVELKLSATATISLNDSAVRGLFGKPSGAISLSDGYGKANEIVYINTFDRTAASIFELMGSPTQPNTYIFENQATISAGTGSYALRTGVFPVGSILKIVNKGYIRGRGGNGGAGNTTGAGGVGGAGGSALYIDMNCTIDNGAGYIFGGGGGGGGCYGYTARANYAYAPGGGGAGSNAGGAGGGQAVAVATLYRSAAAGTSDAGGLGAHAGYIQGGGYAYQYGGNGGSPGTAGSAGYTQNSGYSLKTSIVRHAGGSAGAAIVSNGKTVSITTGNNTSQIQGAIV